MRSSVISCRHDGGRDDKRVVNQNNILFGAETVPISSAIYPREDRDDGFF